MSNDYELVNGVCIVGQKPDIVNIRPKIVRVWGDRVEIEFSVSFFAHSIKCPTFALALFAAREILADFKSHNPIRLLEKPKN